MSFLTEMQKYLTEDDGDEPLEDINADEEVWTNGWEIIHTLDADERAREYRNQDAEYDDEYYNMPVGLFTEITGIDENDIEKVNDELETYEGSIVLYKDRVSVAGGA